MQTIARSLEITCNSPVQFGNRSAIGPEDKSNKTLLLALLSVIGQESKLGGIALGGGLQQLIADILGEDRGHNDGRPLCRVLNHPLSPHYHRIIQVKDGGSHKEERLNDQGPNQREEVIVVFVGVASGIDTEGVPKHILIQSQPKY